MLLIQPDSWLQAAVNKWKYPVPREFDVLANTFDLLAMVNSKKKPKPYERPWPSENQNKIGRKRQSKKDVLKRLEAMNPKEENGN